MNLWSFSQDKLTIAFVSSKDSSWQRNTSTKNPCAFWQAISSDKSLSSPRMCWNKSDAWVQTINNNSDGFTSPPRLIASKKAFPSAKSSLTPTSSISICSCSSLSERRFRHDLHAVFFNSCLARYPATYLLQRWVRRKTMIRDFIPRLLAYTARRSSHHDICRMETSHSDAISTIPSISLHKCVWRLLQRLTTYDWQDDVKYDHAMFSVWRSERVTGKESVFLCKLAHLSLLILARHLCMTSIVPLLRQFIDYHGESFQHRDLFFPGGLVYW